MLKLLAGHEGKVMSADIAPQPLGSSSGDRSHQQQDGGGDVRMDDAKDAGGGGGGGLQHLIGSAGYDRTVKLWAPQETADMFAGDDALPF